LSFIGFLTVSTLKNESGIQNVTRDLEKNIFYRITNTASAQFGQNYFLADIQILHFLVEMLDIFFYFKHNLFGI
jgi:hypothetical protein